MFTHPATIRLSETVSSACVGRRDRSTSFRPIELAASAKLTSGSLGEDDRYARIAFREMVLFIY
jgi:hypothetical protein